MADQKASWRERLLGGATDTRPGRMFLWLMVASWVVLGYTNWKLQRDRQADDERARIVRQESDERFRRDMWELRKDQIERTQSREQARADKILAERPLEWDLPKASDIPTARITLTDPIPFVLTVPDIFGAGCGCCS